MLIELAPVMQILEYVGERTSVLTVAPAHSPPLAMNGQQLTAQEGVFEESPELQFDQTASLGAEAGHEKLLPDADPEPVPELEFDQTLEL